ncbi:MAG: sulfatase-like hydrolase/transferase, partial [Verrucomicrobia bacterium]|nr:sulfatase-like hydrolase/transferase [Verrucomicrobiota bacterium]
GFDLFFGTPYSNDSNEWPVGAPFIQVMGLAPLPLMEGNAIVEAPVDQSRLTRRYTERATAFIRQNRDRPFLLYLPHTMPHVPQYAGPEFAGKSRSGLYGDTVEELDWSTGVILDTLRELGLAERTLVVFTSDNGAPIRRNPGAMPKAAAKKQAAVAAAERFPGRSHGGSNGPLRAGKGTTFEGGVRVPFIAWWPGTIAPGRVVATPVSLMDLFPTCARLADAALPSDRVYDGRDLGPELTGAGEMAPRPIFYYFGYQAQAVREANWKLFVAVDRRPEPRPVSLWFDHQPRLFETQHRLLAEPELYDLGSDVGETSNVAKQHPEIVARLTRRLHEFDAELQRDRRPMEFVPGPPPPAPQTVRTVDTDLSAYLSL